MKRLIWLLLPGFIACHSQRQEAVVWSDLPETRALSEVANTDFVPALECIVDTGRNVIYTPAFLYAWQEVKKITGITLRSDIKNAYNVPALMRSQTYESAMKNGDYQTEVESNDNRISVRAFFRTKLPFRYHMDIEDVFLFGDKKVKAFGMKYYNYSLSEIISLPYYKNDDHFIVRLGLLNPDYELLLVKGAPDLRDLAGTLEKIYDLMNDKAIRLEEEDVLLVPMIRFNLETNYEALESTTFKDRNKVVYQVDKAYQRTGFALTEKGAIVESEAEAIVSVLDSVPVPPVPKKLLFNKPFYIIIKRKDTPNPCFMMRVKDAAFMEEVK